jgi:hypothetical protein
VQQRIACEKSSAHSSGIPPKDDNLDFGLIACREAVPDVQEIADFIVEEFSLLRH